MALPAALLASTALIGAGGGGVASHDGGTYVVPHEPHAGTTRFEIRHDKSQRVVTLRGDYSLDAISPNGSKIYVIRYLSADRAHYAVQAFDASDATPVPKTVVEKGEPGEEMAGAALARTTNEDGSWVYTLYDGAGKDPFVHALDTVNQFTLCIDLHALAGRPDIATLDLKLQQDSHELQVTARETAVAVVHLDTFQVTNPPPPPKQAEQAPKPAQAKESRGGTSWPPIVLAIGALLLAAAATTKHLQTRPNPTKI